jgi:NAD(P)-dependent dehydrogenase (short-subunit alcohol dehydrogenase family)
METSSYPSNAAGLRGKTAVITGAGSGIGLEFARIAARHGMQLVLVDVHQASLDACAAEVQTLGCTVMARKVNVASATEMDALAAAVFERFGAPHVVFNNAGVATQGLVWECSSADWEWVLGVNLWGVIHGIRAFTPLMLRAAENDASWHGHIINTASMAGLVAPANLSAYCVSKHAVVALSETLFNDLRLVTDQVTASVVCPFFVPTGIHQSARTDDGPVQSLTKSQLIGRVMMEKAVTNGTLSAAEVASQVFDALSSKKFYVFTHPDKLQHVADRMEAILSQNNPPDPFVAQPDMGVLLRAALRAPDAFHS